jgi:biopolymer transport protein ExbD
VQHEVLGEEMKLFRSLLVVTTAALVLGACTPEGPTNAGDRGTIVLTDTARDKRMVVITITKEGKCLYEGTPLSSCDDVFEAAEERMKFAPNTEVVVLYDRTVQHAAVIGVLDQLHRAGIHRVSLSNAEGG